MTRTILLFLTLCTLLCHPVYAILKGSNDRFIYTVSDDGILEILNKVTLKSVVYEHKHKFFKGTLNAKFFCGLYDESARCYSLEVVCLETGKRVYQFCVSKQTKTFAITETHIYLPNYATGELKIISFDNLRHHERMTICYQARNFIVKDTQGVITSDFDQHSIFIADLKTKNVPEEICLKPFVPKAISIHNNHLYVTVIHPNIPAQNYLAVYALSDLTTCIKIPLTDQPTFMTFSQSHLYTLDPNQKSIAAYDLKTQTFVGRHRVTVTDDVITSFVMNNSLYVNYQLECPPHPADDLFDFWYLNDLQWSYISNGVDIFNDYKALVLKDEPTPWEPITNPEHHLGCAVKLKFLSENNAPIDLDDLRSSPQVMEAVLKTPVGSKSAIKHLCTLIWEDQLTHKVSFLAKASGKLSNDPKAYLIEFLLRIKHPQVMAFAALAYKTKKTLTAEDLALFATCKKYACPKLVESFTEEVPPIHD